ncbi:MAG: tripartite tricarboxylate transporter substrate binding protein [Rubritepida sp.]|nr:tripartite tricarboxylate transporter substrate binding protein [Rubritepida sp.]
MNIPRRALAALAAVPSAARAQSFPTEAVKLVIPFPPGGPTDLVGRALAREMAADWGQPVVVDNRAGGNGLPAAEFAARARPDGHTLFMPFFGTLVVNPGLYASLPYDPIRDFAPITLVATLPLMLVVHPSAPWRTLDDVIADAKRRPGAINYASGGIGQGAHLAGALFAKMAGIQLTHVPYRGNAPAVADVIAGHVNMIFDGMATSLPHVRDGRLRAIAISTARRASAMPDLPTVAESGLAGFDVGSWFGLLAPAGTPAPVVERINAEVRTAMGRETMRQLISDAGLEAMPSSPEEFATMMRTETQRWTELIREIGIRVD